jgi:hypothetical protein
MFSTDANACRVCGFLLDEPPWGADGRTPLFDFCPCCGVEFGYQDATPVGAKHFRAKWVEAGAMWNEPAQRPPEWDLATQLEQLPRDFK